MANSGFLSESSAQDQTPAPAVGVSDQDREQVPGPLSEEELEVLVARIALYPDELVAVVTSASLFPLQIVEAARFLDDLKKDSKLKPKESWDGSIISLLNYPEIVTMMSDDLDWTQSLGQALAYQQKDVLIAIQQLRDKAVADGIVKTDDKIKVERQNDNIVIQSASTESIYVPRYEPQMLYEPGYQPVPISYYPDPYPYYYYPTATFFAGAVTGAIWGAAMDWDDWGVWGGHWDRDDIDIDCDKCFNNIDVNGKMNWKDVDWRNVDRSKIKFDRNQFANIDRSKIKNDFKSFKDNNLANKAKAIRSDRVASVGNRVNKISVDDVRKSKVAATRNKIQANRGAARNKIQSSNAGNRIREARPAGKINHKITRQRPGGRIEHRGGGRPSAMGRFQGGRHTQLHSRRGHHSLGGGLHGGGRPHRHIHRGGGRHR
ncbi:DUF3300 domain-containing protein [Candidatus Phyllobacterium onerii]|uniref:DUF3300 domain-containing protein n=1 Tax=Candidatus Phyllobacterium onerii TaxID=3020828 RepID=UPI00232D28AD|nr:DUF3300 domain-containing protein [Phyllobacterium sp. IY22]